MGLAIIFVLFLIDVYLILASIIFLRIFLSSSSHEERMRNRKKGIIGIVLILISIFFPLVFYISLFIGGS